MVFGLTVRRDVATALAIMGIKYTAREERRPENLKSNII